MDSNNSCIYFIFCILCILILCKSLKNKFINIIIIRFHTLTIDQITRFEHWINESEKYNKYLYLTDINISKHLISNCFCLSAKSVVRNFPNIINSGRCKNKSMQFYVYTFHIEHIAIFLKIVERKYDYKYVWIIEQDTGYSGNLNILIYKYEKIESDFLSHKYFVNNLGWYNCCTNEYMRYRN